MPRLTTGWAPCSFVLDLDLGKLARRLLEEEKGFGFTSLTL